VLKPPRFPLSRIKKIMKSVPGAKMACNESALLMEQACEFFIHEMAGLAR